MELNMDGCSFWEWYVLVADHLSANGWAVPLPSGDTENATPGSIEAMFNCNYDAHVAANEIAKTVPGELGLRDAAMLALRLISHMTSEQFRIGADRPARKALNCALTLDRE